MRRGTAQSPARTAHQRILAAKKEGQWQEALNIIAEMREPAQLPLAKALSRCLRSQSHTDTSCRAEAATSSGRLPG